MDNDRPIQEEMNRQQAHGQGGSTIVDFNYEKYAEVEKKATQTDATISLVCGIVSIVMAFLFALGGLIVGIVGIVFGLKGMKNPQKKGMAIGGLVCSIVGTVISAIAIVLFVLFLVGFTSPLIWL